MNDATEFLCCLFSCRYIAQNPDAEKKEEEYESWEQRELRQIYLGQSQVCDTIACALAQ